MHKITSGIEYCIYKQQHHQHQAPTKAEPSLSPTLSLAAQPITTIISYNIWQHYEH